MAQVLLDNATIGRGGSVLVRNVRLAVEPGDIVRITGANGAGKSTLAATVLGIVRPLEGRRGRELPRPGSLEHQRFFGYMPATVRPLPALTIKQWFAAIDSGFGLVGGASQKLWERLGGRSLPGAALKDLSSGNLRKAFAVNAFAIPRRVLVLDEPFEELDAESRATVAELIAEQAAAGASVLLISHTECAAVTQTYAIEAECLTVCD